MMTQSERVIPEQDRSALTIQWGDREIQLPVNRRPCEGESLWSTRLSYGMILSVIREHVGRSTPWRASVMTQRSGAYGYGMTMESAVIDCRNRLRSEYQSAKSEAGRLARALGIEESGDMG